VTQRNPAPRLSSPRTAPSIHVRAALTWLAIFPLVAIGLTAMAPSGTRCSARLCWHWSWCRWPCTWSCPGSWVSTIDIW